MNKDDYLRLLEKIIEELPNYITATAGLITAVTISRQQKKRKPRPRKFK